MTSLPATPSTSGTDARLLLRERVDRMSTRAVVLRTIGGLLLALACFVMLLFVLAVIDVVVPLPGAMRWGGLLVAVVASGACAMVLALRPWLSGRRRLEAAEHIEDAAGANDQPIVRGLSLMPADADPLTETLRGRAEQRAAHLASTIEPHQAYPATALRRQGRWLWLACVGWLVLAIVFPNQLLGVFTRAIAPWMQTPPFNLTQLEPTWTPKPPNAGEDVTVNVDPSGRQPDGVEMLLLDEEGEVVESIPMTADEQGGYSHTLRNVDEPVTFKLQTNGRATKSYTIEPTPVEPQPAHASQTSDPTDPGGTTQYDPDAVAQRDAVPQDWQALRDRIESLLADLAEAEARAGEIDPSDAQAIQDLADLLASLSARAGSLAGDLSTLQTGLPAEAAASLAQLQAALSQLQAGQLPNAPGDSPSAQADWLNQAGQATSNDQARIARGLGESDVPSDSGTASGQPDPNSPAIQDPRAEGGYDSTANSGEDGPLPAAVMRQVPPRYRALITAYFNQLTKPEPEVEP